jgi:hypothetical protein
LKEIFSPDESFPHMHFRFCLKSNTNIRPESVPTHISPFAAMTVGEPSAKEPNTVEALADAFA